MGFKLQKPWKPKSEQVPLTDEEEIEKTEKMLRKMGSAIDINLRLAKMAPNGIVMIQSQIWGMIEAEIKERVAKAQAKGETLTADAFMARMDKVKGIYEFYEKVDITKERIREKAEEIIGKGEVAKEGEGMLNLAPLVAEKMKQGMSSTDAFKEAYEELGGDKR